MKKIYSCLFILPLFISCTTESELPVIPASENQLHYSQRLANEPPTNSRNGYDVAGELYNELLDTYTINSSGNISTASILTQINGFALENSRFQTAKGGNYTPSAPTAVQSIISNPITGVLEIVNRSGMDIPTKLNFITFLQDLKTRCKNDEDFESIYNFIISYEDNIIASTVYNTTEKQIILTSTSIARFSTYRGKRKPKKNTDRDWDLMIAGIAAGTEGVAQFSIGNAVTMSATVTITFE